MHNHDSHKHRTIRHLSPADAEAGTKSQGYRRSKTILLPISKRHHRLEPSGGSGRVLSRTKLVRTSAQHQG